MRLKHAIWIEMEAEEKKGKFTHRGE